MNIATLIVVMLFVSVGLADQPNEAVRNSVVNSHNWYRDSVFPPAEHPIQHLEYDLELEEAADAYAEQCLFVYSSRRGTTVGENIAAIRGHSANADVLNRVTETWASERQYYSLNAMTRTDSCSGNTCEHYTQQIWANTSSIGCAYKSCSENSPFDDSDEWTMVVCNYAAPGNRNGEIPYIPIFAFANSGEEQVEVTENLHDTPQVMIRDDTHPDGGLIAEWIDPEDSEFEQTIVLHPEEFMIHSERATVSCSSCSCPSKFAATNWDQTNGVIPQNIRDAIEYTKCLWSCTLPTHPGGIRLTVHSQVMSGSTLAYAGPRMVSSGNNWVYCPLNPSLCGSYVTEDINMYIDPADTRYYYDCDGAVPSTKYDFVSVALHELGHGLGFSGSASNSNANYGTRYVSFDRRLTVTSSSPSQPWNVLPPASNANAAAISDALFFSGTAFTNGKINAPTTYRPGSSIYHWDEATYARGTTNSLMTPSISNGEVNHAPGPLTCDVLLTIGYSPDPNKCGSSTGSTPTPTRSQAPSATRTPAPPASVTPTRSRPVSATPTRTPAPPASATRTRTPTASRSRVASTPTRTPTRAPTRSR